MLKNATLQKIHRETSEHWLAKRTASDLVDRAEGKEIGHRLADWVDEQTCAVLTLSLETKRQHGKNGVMSRSMGDIWVADNRIYHPVNVKTGVVGAEGQPNLVSLKKVLDAFLSLQIDSYYLLFVKFSIGKAAVDSSVYLVDMLDVASYLTFDSGPGQMMLKSGKFFTDIQPGVYTPESVLSFADRIDLLLDMLEDGEKRLRENRQRDLAEYRARVGAFRSAAAGLVTPETQRELNLR